MKGVKTSFNEAFFDEVGVSQAWLLGLLAADGCIIKDRHCHLGQSGDDGLEIIEKVVSLLEYSAPIGYRTLSIYSNCAMGRTCVSSLARRPSTP